jgi:hypothetical protein
VSAYPALDEEIRLAEEKFAESKELAEVAMYNVLNNDVSAAVRTTYVKCELIHHKYVYCVMEGK